MSYSNVPTPRTASELREQMTLAIARLREAPPVLTLPVAVLPPDLFGRCVEAGIIDSAGRLLYPDDSIGPG